MVRGVVPTRVATSPMRRSSVGSVTVISRTSLIDPYVKFEEVFQQPLPVRGEDGLGVELDPFGGQLAVADAHEHAAAGGRGLEAVGERVRVDDERVVAPGLERRGDVAEDRLPVVLDGDALAVD